VLGAAVARVLHQAKNPLQSIILHADLLQEPAALQSAAVRSESSRAIASEAERLAAMLAELTAYAASGERVIQRAPVALHEMVREVAA
jgi:signal transduction histidine kinase